MASETLAEQDAACVRILEEGWLDPTIRFSRRHRWKPLAFAVDGPDAVVVIADRAKRSDAWIQERFYRRDDRGWRSMGTSGSNLANPSLPTRPASSDAYFQIRSHTDWGERGRVRQHRSRVTAVAIVADEVVAIEQRGRRTPVVEHGFVCIVGRRRRTMVRLLDAEGRPLATIGSRDLRTLRQGMPWTIRARIRLSRHRLGDEEWFNYAPRR